MLVQNNLGSNKIFDQKSLSRKSFGPKQFRLKMLISEKFWVHKTTESKNLNSTENYSAPEKMSGPK